MNVIGHYHKTIQFYFLADMRGASPFFLNDVSILIQPNFPLNNFTKQTFPVLGNHGYEIRARLRIIVFFQAEGTAMKDLGRGCHDSNR